MPERATKRERWLAFLAALAGVLAYLNALTNPFVYDDLARFDRPLGPLRTVISPRPLTELSHFVDRLAFGIHPLGHHAVNLLLHALSVVLCFRLAYTLPQRYDADRRARIAFVAALLFAIHPLETEAVGYLSARSDLLCCALSLGATLVWLRWRTDGGVGRALGVVALYVLALSAKETAAALPFVWLAGELALRDPDPRATRARVLGFHAPLVAITLLLGGARLFINRHIEHGQLPTLPHLLRQCAVVWRTLALVILPRGQTIFHGVPTNLSPASPIGWLSLAGLLALVALAVAVARRRPEITFSLVWLLAFLVPGAVLPLRDALAEHRAYLASVGALILASLALAQLPPRAATALTLLLTAALGLATLQRNRVWASPPSLWREAVRAAPRAWGPRYALGDALRREGDCQEAVLAYAEAERLLPRAPQAYVNRALCLVELGDLDGAQAELNTARTIAPADPAIYNDLGMVALTRGHTDEARAHFEEALSHDPNHALARANLARLRVR